MDIYDQKRLLVSEIVKIGVEKSFHRLKLQLYTDITFKDRVEMIVPTCSYSEIGLYAIYAEELDSDECLYVGESDHSLKMRVKKFFNELGSCSHEEEHHCAGEKARDIGGYRVTSHEYKIKWVSWDEIHDAARRKQIDLSDPYVAQKVLNKLDESVALKLKAKYNSNTYKMYGYVGPTLEEFLEDA